MMPAFLEDMYRNPIAMAGLFAAQGTPLSKALLQGASVAESTRQSDNQKAAEERQRQFQARLPEIMAKAEGMPPEQLALLFHQGGVSPEVTATIIRTMAERGKPQLRTVGNDLIDANTGQLLYRAPAPGITEYQAAQLGMSGASLAQAGEIARENRALREWQITQTLQDKEDRLEYERTQKRKEKIENDAQRYSTQVADLAELKESVDTLNKTLPPAGQDIPGFGLGMGLAPDIFVSEEGRTMRQNFAAVRNSILKARSGGAITESEGSRLLQELGEGTGKDDNQLRRGVESVNRKLNQMLTSKAAGVDPAAIELYKERGGRVVAGPPYTNAPSPPPASGGAAPAAPQRLFYDPATGTFTPMGAR